MPRAEQVKLRVVWLAKEQKYFCSHPHTNVKGYGPSPGDAIRDWQWWWKCPVC